MMMQNNRMAVNTIDVNNYTEIRDALENESHELMYPFEITYSATQFHGFHSKLIELLKESSFTWIDEHDGIDITIRSESEAREYVEFAEDVDYLCASKKADEIIAETATANRMNMVRKICLMKTKPVAKFTGSREELIRSLMK